MTHRRLSQAIAEGDGISVLVHVRDAAGARGAEASGAEGIVVRVADADVRDHTLLPLLAYGPAPEEAGVADAVVLAAADEETLLERAERCHELGLEIVIRVLSDEELEHALEHLDPEIVLLAADAADDEQSPLDRVLELLPDVPAGKLAIAELSDPSREDVEELERAGVDAVLVAGNVEALVGDGVPDV